MKGKISGVLFSIIFFAFFIAIFVFSAFWGGDSVPYVAKNPYYTITDYSVEANYHKDNTIYMKETISILVLEENIYDGGLHGIVRAVPEVFTLQIEGDKNPKKLRQSYSNFYCNENIQSIESENNYTYIFLGNYSKTLHKGNEVTYNLTYNVDMDPRYVDYNTFYYNVLCSVSETDIAHFSAKVSFDEDVKANVEALNGYIGPYGSSNPIENDNIKWINDKTFIVEANKIKYATGITIKCDFDKNFQYATDAPDLTYGYISLGGLIAVLLIAFICLKTTSNKTKVTPVVQFKPNAKFTSADIGYIIDKKVNSEDIASLIIYWADKGYLEIIEERKKTYLQATDKETKDMKDYEKSLFEEIFDNRKGESSKINIKKIGEKIKYELPSIKKGVVEENKKLFSDKAIFGRGISIFLVSIMFTLTLLFVNKQSVNDLFVVLSIVAGIATCIMLFVFAGFIDKKLTATKGNKVLNIVLISLLLIALLVFCILSFNAYFDKFFTTFIAFGVIVFEVIVIMSFNVRTDEGCKELGDIVGLKNFIQTSEVSRLRMLAKENPELYFGVMPYAYVLGLYDDWCKKFETINVEAPSFYHSDTNLVFNLVVFNSIMHATTTSLLSSINMATAAKTIQGIGTSSFGGGGGFSGGGAGGGGIGSW